MTELIADLKPLIDIIQLVFLYALKILSDIRKELHNHRTEIEVLKFAIHGSNHQNGGGQS